METPRPNRGDEAEFKSILFLGDVMVGRLVNKCILKSEPEFVWGDTLPILQSADAVLANLEVVVAKSGTPWLPTKTFYFKADPKAIDVLKAGKIAYVTNANNHAMDYEKEALIEMLGWLNGAHINHSGAGRNLEEAIRPAFLSVGGLKAAIIAWTDNEPDWKAGENFAGTHYLEINLNSLEVLRDQMKQARHLGANTIVISAHWGPNMREFPSLEFQNFAQALIDAGADIFYGHSSHVFQGVEIYKDKLIMYDTGDFIDDYAVDPVLRNDFSYIFKITFDQYGKGRLKLIPVHINGKKFCQVNLADGKVAEAINRRMRYRSSLFGTVFEQEGENLILKNTFSISNF